MSTPSPTDPSAKTEGFDLVMDIPVEVTVELGGTEMSLLEITKLAPGSVVALNQKSDEPVNLYVNHKLIARGDVVLVENNLGIKITQVMSNPATNSPAKPSA